MLIRSLFWHRQRGDYRVDGRTKLSWIAQTFGISRRSVTDAMAKLIELGWLETLPSQQYQLNRWGIHVRIVTDWKSPDKNSLATEQGGVGESASPQPDFQGESASPSLNRSASLTGTKKTRRLAPRGGAGTAGLSRKEDLGSRKKRPGAVGGPSLRDIRPEDLGNTERLLELFEQAVDAGLISGSDAGRLDFFAIAERARARAHNPGGLVRWLLVNKRFEFITQADEDAAVARLRALRDGPCHRDSAHESLRRASRTTALELTDDERFMVACIRVGKQNRCDSFSIARQAKGWTRDRWETIRTDYDQKKRDQLVDDEG